MDGAPQIIFKMKRVHQDNKYILGAIDKKYKN